jgi:hypothetical protein
MKKLRTGKETPLEMLHLIPRASKDDPIYKLGFVIGMTRPPILTKNNSNSIDQGSNESPDIANMDMETLYDNDNDK